MRSSLVLSFVAPVLFLASPSWAQNDTNPYITTQIVDGSNFCTFLPPADSEDRNIDSTEYMANVFCTGTTPLATPAGKLAEGFILSAHYASTADYVQVTGQIDPTKMNLNVTDEGGQYDIVMPAGASCVGWTQFVNLIEPAGHTFCIRCCNDKTYCNRGISQKGCAHIVEGDYSGPLNITYDDNGNPVINGVPVGGTPAPSNSVSQTSGNTKPSATGAQENSTPEGSAAGLLPSFALSALAGVSLTAIFASL